MKILISGNHTCSNRGDAAILRGLISAIRGVDQYGPEIDIEIVSRHPLAERFAGHPVRIDPLYRFHDRPRTTASRCRRWLLPLAMAMIVVTNLHFLVKLLPSHVTREIDRIKGSDAIFQVGGSFFVDIYGPVQFEYPLAALLAGRPVFFMGHSAGPFGNHAYRWLMSVLLARCEIFWAREAETTALMEKAGLPTARVRQGNDTAWLAQGTRGHSPPASSDKPFKRVAISFRDIGPFADRLGISQDEYESGIAGLIDLLIGLDCEVLAVSMCTKAPGYHIDDLEVARRLRARIPSEKFRLALGDPDDEQLGLLLETCDLIVATRLHSAIIGMNSGAPALVLSYEHKSIGIMDQLGLGDLSFTMNCLIDGSLEVAVRDALENLEDLRTRIRGAVLRERQSAQQMVQESLGRVTA